MSATIKYKGETIATASNNTKTLLTAGKYMEANVVVTDNGGGGATLQTKSVSYTPSETAISDSVTPDPGYDGMDQVNVSVGAISSTYVGSDIARNDSTDLTASGATVTAPAGYYASNATKTIPNASAPYLSAIYIESDGTASADVEINTGGYLAHDTYDATLNNTFPVQGAQTIYPSTSDQSIASGKYLTGAQTIKGVTCTNLTAGNIKKDVVVKIGDSADDDRIVSVTGTYEGGGGGLPTAADNDVNFIDYDGTIRYSYSKAEFAQLSALPPNPTHSGLVSQGWNWTLADAQTFVAKYGILDIGQMYTTDDGTTRFYVTVKGTDIAPTATINFKQSVANGVSVDWGDGSPTETRTGTNRAMMTHDYSADGDYVIKLKATSGTLVLQGAWNENVMGKSPNNSSYANSAILTKVEVGANTEFSDYAFLSLSRMRTISIPNTITNMNYTQLFYKSRLASLVVPSSCTMIGGQYLIVATPCQRVSLPKSMTYSETNSFPGAENAVRFVMTGQGRVANAPFNGGNFLQEVVFTDDFVGDSVPQSCFANCGCLARLTIPATVTSIGTYAFNACYRMLEYHFKSTTPPTLANTNAFNQINANCKIYVPSASLSDYQTATNWSNYASYMVGE